MKQSRRYEVSRCIYNSKNSIIYLATDTSSNKPVILKTLNTNLIDTNILVKLQNEYNILSKLKSEFIPRAIDYIKIDDLFFIVMEYYEGVTVGEYIRNHKVTVKEFLYIAREILNELSDIHNAGIIHKDINPSNIIYNHKNRKISIIDFGISTEFSYEKQLDINPTASGGNLYYISPEQTGRMNRSIDFRTDFYSLGVSFFEILCGRHPFESESPTELIYSHLAKLPPLANKINPEVPEILSKIIAKLMAKMPEDRYSNTEGILFDLNKCINNLNSNNQIDEFELGMDDYTGRFEISQKLYGREKEIESLLSTYRNIVNGGKSLVAVSGHSGVGKSSLVGELHKPIVNSNGLFISGKFDQYHRNIPYYALSQAIDNFCDIILSENENSISIWKARIENALGNDAHLLVDKVPKLALITRKQQSPAELSPIEERARFKAGIQNLLAAIASTKQSLVLFIDDIHLADTGSLEIIEDIMSNDKISCMCIVTCYRDNEVDDSHPLILSMNKMINREVDLQRVSLSGLSLESSSEIIADALHYNTEEVAELAEVVYNKTYGNPFYMKQFLKLSYMKGFISFDKESKAWRWDVVSIKECPAEKNVVDFLLRNIGHLYAETIRLLSLGACIGQRFKAETLSVLSEKESEQIISALKQAVSLEIVYPLQNKTGQKAETEFQFSHDRFQQTFYTLLSELERSNIHYTLAIYYEKIGFENYDNAEIQFIIADNYFRAFSIINEQIEKRRIAGILLRAAHYASILSAFDTAARYLEQIINTFVDGLVSDKDFAFLIYTEYHSNLCSLARYEDADKIYALISEFGENPIALTDSCCLQAVSLSNRGKYKDAFMLGIALLEKLGVHFSEDDLYNTINREIDDYYAELEKGDFVGIEGKGIAEDSKEFVIGKLLNRITPAGFFCEPMYSFWAIITNAGRMLKNGYTPEGLQIYATLAILLTPFRNDYKLPYIASRKAMKLAEENGYKNELYRIYHVFSLFTAHWFDNVENSIPYARESFKGNFEVGDFEFACFSYFTTQQAVLETCKKIEELCAENEAALAFANKTGNLHAYGSYINYKQFYKSLKGKTLPLSSFDDENFKEQVHLESISGNAMAICYYYILRTLSAVIYSDFDTAFDLTEKAAPLMPAITV